MSQIRGLVRSSRRLGRGGLREEDFVRRIPTDAPLLEIRPFVSPRLTGDQGRCST